MGRLERHLDLDAIARVLNKTPRPAVEGVKRQKMPRKANTYRAFSRNDAKGTVWQGVSTHAFQHPPVRLNRSRHLPFAASYVRARAIAEINLAA